MNAMSDLSFLFDQHDTKLACIPLGKRAVIADCGCEVLALYNTLCALGVPRPFAEVLHFAEKKLLVLGSGKFGCDPFRFRRFAKAYGLLCKRRFSERKLFCEAKAGDVFFVSYFNHRFFRNGIHTFLVVKAKDGFLVYNGYGAHSSDAPQKAKDLSEVRGTRRFLVGYRVWQKPLAEWEKI